MSNKLTAEEKIARKIDRWAKGIPSAYLLLASKTPEQVRLWFNQREQALDLCECLKGHFQPGSGNRLLDHYKAKKITKFDYDAFSALTDMFVAQWQMVQGGWSYIKPVLNELIELSEDLEGPIQSDVECFKLLLTNYFDFSIIRTHGYVEITTGKTEKTLKEHSRFLRAGLNNDEAVKKLSELHDDTEYQPQAEEPAEKLVLIACWKHRKEDPAIERRIHNYMDKRAAVVEVFAKQAAQIRKGRVKETGSFRWIEGRQEVYVKNSWKPVKADNTS